MTQKSGRNNNKGTRSSLFQSTAQNATQNLSLFQQEVSQLESVYDGHGT